MMIKTLLERIASVVSTLNNERVEAKAHVEAARQELQELNDALPSGSGFDSGSEIDLDRSRPDRIVITTAYHHMNEDGYYDGWTEHVVTITPSLLWDFDLKVSGRNRNDIKDYIADVFRETLTESFEGRYDHDTRTTEWHSLRQQACNEYNNAHVYGYDRIALGC